MLSYYNTPGAREICHAVKESSGEKYWLAIEKISSYLASHKVKPSDFLIPAPQHNGISEYTLDIANRVAKLTGATVLDILRRIPEKSLYKLKAEGIRATPALYLEQTIEIPQNGTLFFLDNVIATGVTFQTANSLLSGRLVPLVYAIDDALSPFSVFS